MMKARRRIGVVALLCSGLGWWSFCACAQTAQEAMSDAWWTGPMLANSAETLPPGHFLFEPYLYDIRSPGSDSFGSRSYILYGLANRLSIGVIPVFGYNRVNNGPNSAGMG